LKKFILSLSLVSIVLLQAQILTLDESINKTLDAHPNIKKFMLQIQTTKQSVNIAKSDYLPQIYLNAEYDISKTYALPVQGVFHTKEDNGWQGGITIRQKIWDFSKTTSTIKAQQIQEDIAKLSLQEAKALLVYRVKLQYELAFIQKKSIDVNRADLKAKQELYRQAKALLKQGLKTKADTTRIYSSVLVAQNNLAISKANFKKALITLSLYMNEPLDDNIVLENSIINSHWQREDSNTLLENSPTLQSLKKNIDKNRLLYQATKSSQYGSIDAIGSYIHQDTLNSYDSKLLGITITVPLYTGGKNQAVIEQANINKESAKVDYDIKALAIKEEFEQRLIDLQTYQESIEAKEAQIDSAKETQKVMEARYRNGLATYIEVLDATSSLFNAKLGLLQAQYSKSSTIHRLEYLNGEIK